MNPNPTKVKLIVLLASLFLTLSLFSSLSPYLSLSLPRPHLSRLYLLSLSPLSLSPFSMFLFLSFLPGCLYLYCALHGHIFLFLSLVLPFPRFSLNHSVSLNNTHFVNGACLWSISVGLTAWRLNLVRPVCARVCLCASLAWWEASEVSSARD